MLYIKLPPFSGNSKQKYRRFCLHGVLFSVPAWLPDRGLSGNPATIYNNPLQPLQKSANLYTKPARFPRKFNQKRLAQWRN
jgi:hypothetical protein